MPTTLEDFTDRVLRRLNVPDNSPVGALDDGGGGETLTTAQMVVDMINLRGQQLAETCVPLEGSGTLTVGATLPLLDVKGLTIDDAALHISMWLARGVRYTTTGGDPVTTTLTFASRASMQIQAGGNIDQFTATGTPSYWTRLAAAVIGLSPAPTAGTLTVRGLCRPPIISRAADPTTTNVFTWLTEEDIEAQVAYVAVQIAYKQAQDATISDRIPAWQAEADDWRMRRWMGVDAATKKVAYPSAPAATATSGKK